MCILLGLAASLMLVGCTAPTSSAQAKFHPETVFETTYEFPAEARSSEPFSFTLTPGAAGFDESVEEVGFAATGIESDDSIARSCGRDSVRISSSQLFHVQGNAKSGTGRGYGTCGEAPVSKSGTIWFNGTGSARVHVLVVST